MLSGYRNGRKPVIVANPAGRPTFASMTLADLARRLEAAGASPANYSLGTRPYDGDCLLQEDGLWKVFYTERGRDSPPSFTSPDEAAACQYYYDFTMRMQHRHLVGFLRSEAVVQAVRAQLERHGIATFTDRILYRTNDWRTRVFVMGTDIFAARQLLGNQLPLEDPAPPALAVWWARLIGWLNN